MYIYNLRQLASTALILVVLTVMTAPFRRRPFP